MNELRFVRTEYNYADYSTSVSPAIERALEEHKSPSTVVLNIFRGGSFTVGVFEDPEKCLDLEYCRKENLIVRRRQNPGGAVWGPDGGAFITMYLDTTVTWVPIKTIKDGFCVGLTSLADSIRELFDVDAVYRPLNDVEVEGRKLVPSSARLENGILTMRFLINIVPINRDVLRRAIRTPIEKIQDKQIKDVGARITCLEDETGGKITGSDLTKITNRIVERIFGNEVELVLGDLSELEREYAQDYQEKYTSEEWFYANSERTRFTKIPPDAVRREGLHKAPAGLIRVTILCRQNKIHDLIITGDFHPTPYQVLQDIEDSLRGKECNIEIINKNIQQIFDRPDVEIAGTEVKDFLGAFIKAFHQTK